MNKIERDDELIGVLTAIEQVLTLGIGDRLVLDPSFNDRQRYLWTDLFDKPRGQRYTYHYHRVSSCLFGTRELFSKELTSIQRTA